ncbi:SusF/SusE family outer membrane protein [uncultured Bacteroides sp.]|uniref:SusF/SusE family outer membrane protein n=1 Tax=uncultured Bacteroides sp. TaxID=162156 RepID=UPI002AA93C00|nr:SusF/SusE family outer membrane protein [uncultured Bacteroides sp.]
MKNLSLYILMLFVTAGILSACDEDFNKDVVAPQSYEEGPTQDANFVVAPTNASINLNEVTDDTIALATFTSTPNYVDGATARYAIQLSETDKFTDKQEITLNASNGVAREALSQAVITLYGRRPELRDLKARAVAYVTDVDGQALYIASNVMDLKVAPIAPVIETAYYLVGDMNGWDAAQLVKFTHSDKDVYDDPYFTAVVKVPAGCYWKIIPQSNVDGGDIWASGALGTVVDGDTSLSGTLTTTDPKAGKIDTEAGYVKFTLNMLEYTYTIEYIGDMALQLYVPGAQGWDPATAPTIYCQNYDLKYDGYVNFTAADQEYKFTSQPNWDAISYGNGGDGTLTTDATAGNMKVSEAGFYRLTADLSSTPLTYTATKTVWGVIGDATEGGWDASTPMTLNVATGEWTVTTTLIGGKSFKFRANDGWDINLGGDANNLTYGGDNMTAAEDGTYIITLKLGSPAVYSCTVVKQPV